MYLCKKCNAVFEQPSINHIPGGCHESDYGVYDEFESHNYYSASDNEVCPECLNSDLEEINEELAALLFEYRVMIEEIKENCNIERAREIVRTRQDADFMIDDEYVFDIFETKDNYDIECNYQGRDYGWFKIEKEVK